MSLIKPQTPVIFLAFANERTESGFLRGLTMELKRILKTLEPAIQKGRCFVKVLPAATQKEIMEVFQDEWYQNRIWIFHYGGHATEDQLWLEGDEGGNQAFFSKGLARFLGAQKGLKLVFLNGCATGDHANLLHESNIPAVITTSKKISDDQAQDFASTFYQGIAGGGNISEAFEEAEGAILGEYPEGDFSTEGITRSLFWEEDLEESSKFDFPWRLSFREEEDWIPKNWRLFYELGNTEEEQSQGAEAFVGMEFNNMKLVEVLGQGSMGVVFKAIHLNLNVERAVKICHKVIEGYDQLKDVVFAGNKGLSEINHPNVVKFFDVGEVVLMGEKRLYMVMELIKGERMDRISMQNWIGGPDNHERLADVMLQTASGLEVAHRTKFTDVSGMPREGIVHGNIKARKILFTTEGVPKLIDFLFTDLSRSHNIKLQLPESVKYIVRGERPEDFIAPEILNGSGGVSKQGDIYSWGAVFFRAITGKAIADFSFNSADELHRFVKQKDWLFPKYLSKI
ncbi:MAG: protein kinase, partial [Bacteroidia bacterium]|nr:protein kinase [Bacteroidia bacterium]